MVNTITYGGLIFDIFIFFLLCYKPTRKTGLYLALIFNVMNAWLFDDINIFPYMMIVALVLFIDPNTVASYLKEKKILDTIKGQDNKVKSFSITKLGAILLGVYFLIQFALPLRHLLFEGNTEWTGHHQKFAWRMKIQTREVQKMEFKVFDQQKKVIYPVNIKSYGVNRDQINVMGQDPKAIVQFAQFLKDHCRTVRNMPDVLVKSNVVVSLNKREPQAVFDPELDLTTLHSISDIKEHILPLKD